jgi:hypothetical protein
VATSDLTGDGKPDILWQNQNNGQVVLFTMNGTTKVAEQLVVDSSPWRIVGTADIDRDGSNDIIWENFVPGQVQVYVWFMQPSGNGFAATKTPFAGGYLKDGNLNTITLPSPAWRVAGVGDVNGDGRPDLVWQNDATGAISIYYLNGLVLQIYEDRPAVADPNWKIKAVGDYNGDGRVDVIWQHATQGDLFAWFLNGTTLVSQGYLNPARVNTAWQIVGAK